MVYNKKRTLRTALKGRKRTTAKRTRWASTAIRDSMKLTVSSYIEIQAQQPDQADNAKGGVVGYSIKCDPSNLQVEIGAQVPPGGTMLVNRMNPATGVAYPVGERVSLDRYERFKSLYRAFRVDSVSLKVTTDRHCGIDNALIGLQDQNVSTPCVDINQAMAQAHKSTVMTEANRTTYYSYKPTSAQQREFHRMSDGVASNCQ